MFKIVDDKEKAYRAVTFNGKTLLKWFRPKFLIEKIDRMSWLLTKTSIDDFCSSGAFKDLQDIQKVFLRVLDNFAKENGIVYWIDYGTLLGAARAGGFIPWDDDIDVMMPREYYERLLSLQDRLPSGYYFHLHECPSGYLIKLKNESLSEEIGLDIFSVDFISEEISLNQSLELTKKYHSFLRICKFVAREDKQEKGKDFWRKNGYEIKSKIENSKTLCYCLDFSGFQKTTLIPADKVFPLSQIEFEGSFYPAPADVFYCLTLEYGDFRTPDCSRPPHIKIEDMSIEDMIKNKKFLEDNL